MSLSAPEIAAVVQELAPALRRGWIQKIFQPGPQTVTLEVRTPGQTLTLLLSTAPDMARLHLLTHRQANPTSPPPFCQFLRARIQGARIDDIIQLSGDRIVRLALTTDEGPRSLVVELTGRTADLVLLDGEDRILSTLETKQDKTGHIYRPPSARPSMPDEPTRTAAATPPPQEPEETTPFPVSSSIERRYQGREEHLSRERLTQTRLTQLRKSIKKAAKRIDALQADYDKASRYKDYARYGELLKTNLSLMTKGQEQITVVDYFDPAMAELTIPLDPSKTPQGNMDDYFKKHRKYLAADHEIKPRLEATERELASLQAERKAIEQGTWQPPAQATSVKPVTSPPSPATRHSPRKGPYRRFTSTDGLPIYVGRNAKENDELTFKFAHSDDLWLHAHGTPGSHVVVRLEKGAEPPHETIKDAATLAVLYSDLKKSGKGEVIYTRRKWVRKAKGQPPGTVTVTQEKAVFVQLDRARLDRLKTSSA